jgi:hypothetical protein
VTADSEGKSLAENGVASLTGLTPGNVVVSLGELEHCTVTGGSSQTVQVFAGYIQYLTLVTTGTEASSSNHRSVRMTRSVLLALMASAVVVACSSTGPDPYTNSNLKIVTHTGGINLDPDGYRIQITALPPVHLGANDSVTIDSIQFGDRTFTIDSIAGNCTIDSTVQHRYVPVGNVRIEFDFTCS